MNERIKELCSQAISDVDGIQNPDTQHMYIPDCFRDRFAELILNECARKLEVNGMVEVAIELKQHFGFTKLNTEGT
jgi:hypothetical protein